MNYEYAGSMKPNNTISSIQCIMTDAVAKAISKRNIIYVDGIPIAIPTAAYNRLERRVARRGMCETVSEYVNLLYQWSLFVEGHR